MSTLTELARGRALVQGDTGPAVLLAQSLLVLHGATIQVDGDFGKNTTAAVAAYQARNGITVSGRIGLDTAASLDQPLSKVEAKTQPKIILPPSTIAVAPWVSTMRAITGQKELPGSADSEFVLGMAKTIAKAYPDLAAYCKQYTHDAIPWCGLTMAYVMAVNGIKPVTKKDGASYGFLWADDWKHFGTRLPKPIPGCVMVFTRNGGGHVTQLEEITPTHFKCRGGNQSDMINVTSFARSVYEERLTAAVWPDEFPIVAITSAAGIASTSTKVT